ncbi:Oidioi.mRNA.OKI2018_I69.chr2.g4147.t1.cds [Oikopleura dioica]|uniref:Oidioi.mRNA.OKI2018_I69.chr2.g4147.t1.cds n=1 Tax=Oikopleura dioica TaxID=34765 RepID=A0ABN7SWD1_OIKDI|nr:Oidioi.mRNA.OKI2018_I69.chr2.g4147.t1.cds [Oikopleura dioica]
MKKFYLFFSAVAARRALFEETCIDEELQKDCMGITIILRVVFCARQNTACRSATPRCNEDCPCGENCPNGWQGCENPICPTTESIKSTTPGDSIFYPRCDGAGVAQLRFSGTKLLHLDRVSSGSAIRIVDMEILEGGIQRGRIEDALTKQQWRLNYWGSVNGGNFIMKDFGEGDFWRFVPHPTFPDTFQIHWDNDYHFDTHVNERNAITYQPQSCKFAELIFTSPKISGGETSISVSFDDSNSSEDEDDDSDYVSTRENRQEDGGDTAKQSKRHRKMSIIADEEGMKEKLHDFLWFPL